MKSIWPKRRSTEEGPDAESGPSFGLSSCFQIQEVALYSRTRDIQDSNGTCLRIGIAAHPSGAMVCLERRDQPHRPSILLSLHGVEILNGFIMSARLTVPHAMPDEATARPFPACFHLECYPAARVVIAQEGQTPLSIDAPLWDRLYAELCLVIAHGREMAHRRETSLH